MEQNNIGVMIGYGFFFPNYLLRLRSVKVIIEGRSLTTPYSRNVIKTGNSSSSKIPPLACESATFGGDLKIGDCDWLIQSKQLSIYQSRLPNF